MKTLIKGWLVLLLVAVSSSVVLAGDAAVPDEPLLSTVPSNPTIASVVELGNDPDIFWKFRECGLDMQYSVEQSAIIAAPDHRIQVDKHLAIIKDGYVKLDAKGSFQGFEIVWIMFPISKGAGVFELYRLNLKGNVEQVRDALERRWNVMFEFRGADDGPDEGDGPQITYASDVWIPEKQVYSRLRLFAQSEDAKNTDLECVLKKRIHKKIGE